MLLPWVVLLHDAQSKVNSVQISGLPLEQLIALAGYIGLCVCVCVTCGGGGAIVSW